MPISVSCPCGKIFNVKDEMAGQQVTCQVCGAGVAVPLEVEAEVVAAPEPTPVATPPDIPAEGTQSCPACAEPIPWGSVVCPFCREPLARHLDPEQARQLLNEAVAEIEAHVASPENLAADDALKGKKTTVRTIVSIVLTVIGLAMLGIGIPMGDPDGVPLIVFGVIIGFISGICMLVSLANDGQCMRIQDVENPEKAFKRFFLAVRSGRVAPAYAALAPRGRNLEGLASVELEKIPTNKGKFEITNPATMKKYWQSIFRGASTNTRQVYLKKIRKVEETEDGLVVVEGNFLFTGYPSLLVLLILINLIVCAIAIAICTKREEKVIRKVMVRRGDRWFFIEGELEGALDRVRLA